MEIYAFGFQAYETSFIFNNNIFAARPLMIENNLYYTLGKVVLLLEIIMGLSVLFVLNTRIDLPHRSRSTAIN